MLPVLATVVRHPQWPHSLHHLVAGALLALVITGVASRWLRSAWLAAYVAVATVISAELVLEIVEWHTLYGRKANAGTYYDTIADMAMSLVGAVIGGLVAGVAVIVYRRIHRPDRVRKHGGPRIHDPNLPVVRDEVALTERESILAMASFLDAYFERTKKTGEIPPLLADLEIEPDGCTSDPAAVGDWRDAVASVRSGGGTSL